MDGLDGFCRITTFARYAFHMPAQDAVLAKEVRFFFDAYRDQLLATTLRTLLERCFFHGHLPFVRLDSVKIRRDSLVASILLIVHPELVERVGVILVNGDLGDLPAVNLEVDCRNNVQSLPPGPSSLPP